MKQLIGLGLVVLFVFAQIAAGDVRPFLVQYSVNSFDYSNRGNLLTAIIYPNGSSEFVTTNAICNDIGIAALDEAHQTLYYSIGSWVYSYNLATKSFGVPIQVLNDGFAEAQSITDLQYNPKARSLYALLAVGTGAFVLYYLYDINLVTLHVELLYIYPFYKNYSELTPYFQSSSFDPNTQTLYSVWVPNNNWTYQIAAVVPVTEPKSSSILNLGPCKDKEGNTFDPYSVLYDDSTGKLVGFVYTSPSDETERIVYIDTKTGECSVTDPFLLASPFVGTIAVDEGLIYINQYVPYKYFFSVFDIATKKTLLNITTQNIQVYSIFPLH